MQLDGFLNERCHFFPRLCRCNTAGEVWYVSTKTAWTLLDDNQVLHLLAHFLNPACFRMLFNVPGGISTLGLPATVTVPTLTE